MNKYNIEYSRDAKQDLIETKKIYKIYFTGAKDGTKFNKKK